MMPQFSEAKPAADRWFSFVSGLILLVIGLSKKVLLADPLGRAAAEVFGPAAVGVAQSFFVSWYGALAYTFQIYFDFSGYSDMALGLALLFGIRLPTNFFSPYKSRSIIDFWRRWHMTLSRFLRDYVYIPLGGNRNGPARRYVNLMATMVIGGVWHGAGWTFLLWGLLHGGYLMANHAWRAVERHWGVKLPALVGWALTFLAVVWAWVPFRAETIEGAWVVYRGLVGLEGFALPLEMERVLNAAGLTGLAGSVDYFAMNSRTDFYMGGVFICVAAAIAFFAPNSIQLLAKSRPSFDSKRVIDAFGQGFATPRPSLLLHPVVAACAGVFFGIVTIVLNAAPTGEFLYFQF